MNQGSKARGKPHHYLYLPARRRGVIEDSAHMAVLHITYKHNRETSNVDYDGFYKVITNYQCRRLSQSNWTINTEEPPQAVWQKLKRHIDPNDYFLMLPLNPSWFTAKDQTVLSWLAARP